ncbi:unnamed protein product [Euphydryas editha]|uniref:Fibrohexamerin n=1 Tax=Euphydryas editha TaxID=104508 RepID=A0AAU9TFT8_EUPED|nr:unnamed protein product [Euphydryas editha]
MIVKVLLVTLTVTACVAVPSNIVRPCNVKDNKCVRDNFAPNSRCNPNVRGFIPGQYTIKQFRFEAPYFNATYIDNNLIISNHNNCFVSEFFFNLGSDVGVLTLDCPSLVLESSRTLIQHASFKEDTAYSFNYKGTYPLVRLTVNLPHANQLDLCSAYTFADVTALPIFNVNPNDQKTANFLSTDLTLMNIYEREAFFYRANQLARYYINSMICDFGCNF